MATTTTMGSKLMDTGNLCVGASCSFLLRNTKPILLLAAACGTMVLMFGFHRNRSNKDKIDDDNRAEDPNDEEGTENRPADLVERPGGAAGEEMDDSGRAGGRDGAAQAEAPRPLPQNDQQHHEQHVVGTMTAPLAPPVQQETDAHDHDILPIATTTLRTGAVPALNQEVPGLDLAQRNIDDVLPRPSTGNSAGSNTTTTNTTTIGNAGNNGNNAMARTMMMMMSSTGTYSSIGIDTTISMNNATEVLKRLQAMAGELNPGNLLHVVEALAAAERGDKITVFCAAVGLMGPLFDLVWEYDEATQHTFAGLGRDSTALEKAQLTQMHKILEQLRIEDDELCGAALLYSPYRDFIEQPPCSTLLPPGDWRAVAISGNSQLLLACNWKGKVYTGKRTETLQCALDMGGGNVIRSFAISDDGVIMVAAADKGPVHVSHGLGGAGTWTQLDSSEGKWASAAWCSKKRTFILIQDDRRVYHYYKDGHGNWALEEVGQVCGDQKMTGVSVSASGSLLVATATYKPGEILGNFVSHDLGRSWYPRPYTLEAENEEAKRALEAELKDKTKGVKPRASACSPSGDRAVIASITGQMFMTWDYGTTWHRLQTPEIPAGTGWPSVQWLEKHPKWGPRILATHIHGGLWESSIVPTTGPAILTWQRVLNEEPRAFYAGSAASTNGSTVLLATRQTPVNRFILNFTKTVEEAQKGWLNKEAFGMSGNAKKKKESKERKGKEGGRTHAKNSQDR